MNPFINILARPSLDDHFENEPITAIMAIRTHPPYSLPSALPQWHIVFRLISSNVLVLYLDIRSRKEDGTAIHTTQFMGPTFASDAADENWLNLPRADRDLTYDDVRMLLSDKHSIRDLRFNTMDDNWDEQWLMKVREFLEKKNILKNAPAPIRGHWH
ncbi:hypothetical protein AX16_010124 [Volvariella volvacea WC 439]|nr:hypothetical protein AX16_010124 [Volvariella volvacea WC 439]